MTDSLYLLIFGSILVVSFLWPKRNYHSLGRKYTNYQTQAKVSYLDLFETPQLLKNATNMSISTFEIFWDKVGKYINVPRDFYAIHGDTLSTTYDNDHLIPQRDTRNCYLLPIDRCIRALKMLRGAGVHLMYEEYTQTPKIVKKIYCIVAAQSHMLWRLNISKNLINTNNFFKIAKELEFYHFFPMRWLWQMPPKYVSFFKVLVCCGQ